MVLELLCVPLSSQNMHLIAEVVESDNEYSRSGPPALLRRGRWADALSSIQNRWGRKEAGAEDLGEKGSHELYWVCSLCFSGIPITRRLFSGNWEDR